ncbi:hypothetical protein ACH42_06455 [Endozoicomonas sp. (ex Bugula neritina AB1)]|nr:hypothetical protein ACH42_06455 [Endozoicomonas sp. (ex Bugula neritina AB1)]
MAVNQTGSTQNAPVDYRGAGTPEGVVSSGKVASGALGKENMRLAEQKAESDVLMGQEPRIPNLDEPREVMPSAMDAASTDVNDVSEMTEAAAKEMISLMKNAKAEELTPEQQARLQEYGNIMEGAGNYIDNLHGKGVGLAEGKRSVLAGLGFSQSQMEALLSLANPDGNSLASLHGGTATLQAKQTVLKDLGFSDSQIEALLSLASPDEAGNGLASLHQAGSDPKKALQALGFSSGESDRMVAMLNGQSPQGSSELRALYLQMGYNDAEIDVLFSAADPKSLQQQDSLLMSSTPGALQAPAASVQNLYSTGFVAADRVIEQLFDIFMVMELLHQMNVTSRRNARESRSMEYDAAKQEVLAQAEEMKEAAMNRLVGGIISGAAKIAAGAISGASAAGGMKGKTEAGADASSRAQSQAAASQASIARGNALAQVVNGAGEMGQAGFNYQASMHDAMQKEHEAYQKTHENAAQSWSEMMQLHQDMVKTVQSKMDEIIRTWYETLKTTTRG